MADVDLLQRMDGLEKRLTAVELLLGLHNPPVWTLAQQTVSQAKRQLIQQLGSEGTASKPDEVFELSEETAEPADSANSQRNGPLGSEDGPTPTIAYQTPPTQPMIGPVLSERGLEQTIGLKWAGWIGAVVLVIGATLGMKYAYDQGWFAVISPIARVMLLAMGGLVLIGVGEWVYRKVNTLSAAGLYGAGVAVLFVVSYAGFAYYDLYPRNAAFVFIGCCTIIGALIARRGQLVSIAVLSLIGGNLAPVLLRSDHPQLAEFLVYLLMLQGVSLALARWGGAAKCWTLRGLSLASTSLWMAAMIDQPETLTLIAFSIVYASLFQLELFVTSLKSKLLIPRTGAAFSLLVTASLTAALLCLQPHDHPLIRLGTVLAMAMATCVASLVCLRKQLISASLPALGIGYAVQTVALVIVAVPVAFSGVWISAAWGVLAIALVVMGYVLELPPARYSAPIVWLLAVGNLSMWAAAMQISNATHTQLLATTVLGIAIYNTTIMSWLLALLGLVIGRFMTMRRHEPATENALKVGLALSICCTGLWMVAALLGLPALPASASILFYASLLASLDLVDRRLNLLSQAAVVLVMMTLKWAVMDTLGPRMLGTGVIQPLLLSRWGFANLMLLVALGVVYYRATATCETNEFARLIRRVTEGMTVAVVFWMGTFFIDQAFINMRGGSQSMFADPDRAEQVALSIFWSVFALASIAGGFGWRKAGLRYFGLALFALALLKVVTIDLSQVSRGYRILSFMGLGLLLLGTSVLYGKVSPLLLAEKTRGKSDSDQ
jgi:uncharacterized membrane protein